jgi:hypothetical protein
MLRILSVGDSIPYDSVIESIQKCMEYDFIANSTYFTNGIFVINDKSKYSYIYDPYTKTITKCSKHDKLFIQYDDGIIFKSFNSFNFLDTETEKIVWDFVKKTVKQFSANNLICIGGDSYIYSFISSKYSHLTFMGDPNFLKDAEYNLKPYNMIYTYFDIQKCYCEPLSEKSDIIITHILDAKLLEFIQKNIEHINDIIIIKHCCTSKHEKNNIKQLVIDNFSTKNSLYHHNKYDTVLVQHLVKNE